MNRLALTCALLVVPGVVESHDIYSGVYNKEGVLCCNEGDCTPAPFRVTPNGVQMLVQGHWIDVPRWYIQYRTLAGDTTPHRSHWCGVLGTFTRCAILPPHASAAPSEKIPVTVDDGLDATGQGTFAPDSHGAAIPIGLPHSQR